MLQMRRGVGEENSFEKMILRSFNPVIFRKSNNNLFLWPVRILYKIFLQVGRSLMIRLFLILILFSGFHFLHSQDDLYYYYYASNYKPVDSKENAIQMKEIVRRASDVYIIKNYVKKDGEWEKAEKHKIKETEEGHLVIITRTILFFADRIHRYYEKLPGGKYSFREFVDGQEIRNGTAKQLIPLHLDGKVNEYYPNGNRKSVSYYENNQLVSNENWLKSGKKYIDNIFYSVDKVPEYSLGYRMFRDYILGGLMASGYNISQVDEKIVLGWVIMENGEIAGVHRVEGKLKKLSELLIHLVEDLPGDWKPAKLENEIVRYYMTIPFNFRQDFESFDTIEFRDGFLIWD